MTQAFTNTPQHVPQHTPQHTPQYVPQHIPTPAVSYLNAFYELDNGRASVLTDRIERVFSRCHESEFYATVNNAEKDVIREKTCKIALISELMHEARDARVHISVLSEEPVEWVLESPESSRTSTVSQVPRLDLSRVSQPLPTVYASASAADTDNEPYSTTPTPGTSPTDSKSGAFSSSHELLITVTAPPKGSVPLVIQSRMEAGQSLRGKVDLMLMNWTSRHLHVFELKCVPLMASAGGYETGKRHTLTTRGGAPIRCSASAMDPTMRPEAQAIYGGLSVRSPADQKRGVSLPFVQAKKQENQPTQKKKKKSTLFGSFTTNNSTTHSSQAAGVRAMTAAQLEDCMILPFNSNRPMSVKEYANQVEQQQTRFYVECVRQQLERESESVRVKVTGWTCIFVGGRVFTKACSKSAVW